MCLERDKKMARDAQVQLSISKYHHLIYSADSSGCMKASEYINGFMLSTFDLGLPKTKDA